MLKNGQISGPTEVAVSSAALDINHTTGP